MARSRASSVGSIRGRGSRAGSRRNSINRSRQVSPVNRPSRANSRERGARRVDVGVNYVYDRITEATNRLTDISIEVFNGIGDIEDWFRRYEDLAIARRWDEIGRKEQLPTFFSGPAGQWLAVRRTRVFSTPVANETRNPKQIPWVELTWPQVKLIVIEHYLPDDYRENLRAELDKPQKFGENLVAFFDRKVYLANKLGRSGGETIKAIKKTLLPEYQKLLGVYETWDLEELLSKLKEAGRIIRRVEKPKRNESRTIEGNSRRHVDNDNNKTNSSSRQVAGSERRNFSCYRCGMPGHIAPNCRAPPHLTNQRRNFTNPHSGMINEGQGNRQGQSFQQQNAAYDGRAAQTSRRENMPVDQNNIIKTSSPQNPPRNINNIINTQLSHKADPNNDEDLGKNHDSEYYIELKIDGRKVKGLLDTGASITCIDYEYFRENWPYKDLLAPEELKLKGVGGFAEVKGKARISYEYIDKYAAKQQVEILTAVLKGLGNNLLIGRDFMNVVNATLEIGKREIICDKPTYPVRSCNITLAYGCETTEIPAKSTAVVPIYVENPHKNMGILTNHESLNNVAVANSIIEIQNDDVLVPITNFTSETLKFEKDDIIGKFEDYECKAEDFEEERQNHLIFHENLRPITLIKGEIMINSQLNEQQVEQLVAVLEPYDEIFSYNGELGDCNVLEHEIDTGDAKPAYSPPYRQSPKIREQIQKQILEWLEAGVIRPSYSPWASPIVIVPKKDNTMRMCIDLRGVNRLTKRDVYPLPNLDDTLTSLNGAIYFSSLDLNQGYMQIRMAQDSIAKTAFISHNGLYEFIRMPFGLTNAPATFQRSMNIILSGLTYNQCLVYLDDIIIFGDSFENHNRNLVNVLQRIKESNLTIKPSKCAFAVQELRFLGHIVGGDGVRMDPNKISTILELPEPRSVTEVKSFVGSASYYRRFVKDFSKIIQPMTNLTKKDVPFEWGKLQQEAFDTIKQRMTTQPILCHFDPKLPMELRTDACGYGLGAILLHQFPDGTKRVISYASRLLNTAEKNYIISEQECLAVVWAIDKFKHCLQGTHFKVITDHQALTWLQSKRSLTGRLMRWALALQVYDFEVIYKSAVHHKDVDHISRNPVQTVNRITYGRRGTYNRENQDTNEENESIITNIETPSLQIDEIIEAQQSDAYCQQLIGNLPLPNYAIKDGILVERNEHYAFRNRIVLPNTLFNRALYQVHDSPLSAHGGYRKTLWRFNQRYYMKNSPQKIKKYVQTCHLCQTKKEPWTKRYGMLQSLESAVRPFQRIGIDTLGPFRKSRRGCEKIVVITDYMTKWSIAKAIPRENSEQISQTLLEEVYLRFGAPEVIISDRGKSFNTELMRNLYREFDSKHVSSTPYHPQTNGLVERFNRTLAIMLSMFVSQHHRDWDEYLPYVVFAYNTVTQDSTGYAPFYLLYGFNARMATDTIDPNNDNSNTERLEILHEARELAINANSRAQIGQKRNYDKKRYIREFREGELVLIHRARGYIGQTTKLRHPYEGPYKILQRNSDLVYLVTMVNRQRGRRNPPTELVHVSRMKPYHSREDEQRCIGNVTQDTEQQHRVNLIKTTQKGYKTPLTWKNLTHFAFTFMVAINCIHGRVVWRKTKFRINKGMQDVTFLVNYKLPCINGTSDYNTEGEKHKFKVTEKFIKWCEDYSSEITQKGLNLFCSDGGTTSEKNPSRAYLRSMLAKNKKIITRPPILKDPKSSKIGGNEETTLPPKAYRVKKKKRKNLSRKKRFIFEAILAVVVVVSLVGSYFYGKSSGTNNYSGDVEQIARQNLENAKISAEEIGEVHKRVDDAFKQINFTLGMVGDIREQVEALQIEANVYNQAIVASLVYNYQTLSHNLRDISKDWAVGKIHPKFMEVFKFKDDCSPEACPIDLYTAESCNYDVTTQDIRFKFKRQIVRDDVEIVSADPFTYYYIEKIGRNANSSDEFWKSDPTSFKICKSSYKGITHLALTKRGCFKRVNPAEPKDTDIPIIIEECFHPKALQKEGKYSDWECDTMSSNVYDSKSVQIKLEHPHILLYCPQQFYQINQENKTKCPDDSVLTLTAHANISVWRHPFRSERSPIIEYSFGALQIVSETTFEVPTDLKFIMPAPENFISDQIEEAKKNITNSLVNSANERQKSKYKFIEYIKTHKWSILTKVLLGIAITLVITIIIIVVVLIIRPKKKPVYQPNRNINVKYLPSSNTSEDSLSLGSDKGEPVVRFTEDYRVVKHI